MSTPQTTCLNVISTIVSSRITSNGLPATLISFIILSLFRQPAQMASVSLENTLDSMVLMTL